MDGEARDSGLLGRSDCIKFEADLAAYLEGEERPALAAHAEHCDFCRCVLGDLEQIRTASSRMPAEAPPPSVWTSVRASLVEEGVIRVPSSFWQRWSPGRRMLGLPIPAGALAAAVAAAIVLFLAPGYLIRPHTVPVIPAAPGVASASYPMSAGTVQLQQTIQELETAYRANEALLEPSMKATYQKSLASLDDEIRDCETSMREEPENNLARQYLSAAYAEKAELLQSALEFNLR